MTIDQRENGAEAAAQDNDGSAGAHALLAVGGVVAVFVVVVVVGQVIIRGFGWVTPVNSFLSVATAAVSAGGAAAFAQSKQVQGMVPRWLIWTGAAGLVLIVVAAWLLKGATSVYAGELTATEQVWERVLSVDTGDRVVVVLDTLGGLDAELRIDRGRWRYDAARTDSSTRSVDQTLHGGQWRIRVAASDGTVGKFEVRVENNPGRKLGIGDVLDQEALTDVADSNGYRFSVVERQAVYIEVDPESDLDVQVDLRRNGWAVANPRFEDGVWRIHRTLEPDDYMLVVRSPSGQLGDFALSVLSEAPVPSVSETTVPPMVMVDLPAGLVGAPEAEAGEQLSGRGFSFAVWNVCSGSVPAGVVRQVIREDPEAGEVVVVDLDGVVEAESRLPADTQLVLKVGTGDTCGEEE